MLRRVRLAIDWPPEPTEIGKAMQDVLAQDGPLPELPTIPAGTWGYVVSDIGGEFVMVEFEGHEPLPFSRSVIEDV